MRAYSISTRVNSVKNDDAGPIEAMMAAGGGDGVGGVTIVPTPWRGWR
jgi:hypothetical protein